MIQSFAQFKKMCELSESEYIDSKMGGNSIIHFGKAKPKKKDYSILKHPLLVGVICTILGVVAGKLL